MSGTLSVVAGGAITDSGVLDVTGVATFTANGAAANVLLDNPANAFAGGVSIVAGDANNVTIIDTSTAQLSLATIAITGNLTIRANGVAQTGPVAVAGKTSITSTGGNIDLFSTSNDFDTVTIDTTGTAANVDLGDFDGITFLASTLGTGGFIVKAGSIAQTGAITQEASAGAVSLTARAGTLVLDDAGGCKKIAVTLGHVERPREPLRPRVAVDMPLAGVIRPIAGRCEQFRQEPRPGGPRSLPISAFRQGIAADRLRIVAGEQGRPGRPAAGGVVALGEPQAAGGQAIKMGRVDLPAIRAQVGEAEIIGEDHDHVWRRGLHSRQRHHCEPQRRSRAPQGKPRRPSRHTHGVSPS